ncbi:DMT family transporter [Gordonia sp. (in: high G+C Gram-positive bacteria)]|uniref:DMT family transporter n=1 Tax=Gordonia sp. (in: high G+C Gram-positive bacteria) TaxID=84139 RepID=UPI003C7171C8
MKKWWLLAAAIVAEVAGTMMLRATVDAPVWSIGVIIGYLAAFLMLGLTLREGMAVGVAYGVWGAVGVALTALLGSVIFDETLTMTSVVGIGVIVVGVLVVHSGEGARLGNEEPIDVAG